MKKIVLSLWALFAVVSVSAQERDTSYWTHQRVGGINLSQVSYNNWAAGGDASVAGDVNFSYALDYKKDKILWQNRLELAYGLNNTDANGTRKTNDKIYLNSMFGYKMSEHWYATLAVNFQTQFDDGYKYGSDNAKTLISRFMSPGYLSVGPGVTWTPKPWFTATFSPATWRGTFVMSDSLSNQGAFGVDPGKHLLSEFGGNVKLEANYEFLPNMTVYSRLELFSNYLDKPKNVDVRWDTQVAMKINKWFSASLNLNLIYDDDTKFPTDDGRQVAKLQLKEVLGVGLQVTF
ncbi:DUF3078 domain-containing protein [Alistipes sp. OttesenSCG-928-L06]|nr:DUF3078 domain-containing protein [Alistipes sp. OttesenSCG-928-L06]